MHIIFSSNKASALLSLAIFVNQRYNEETYQGIGGSACHSAPPGLLEAFFEIACPCPFVSTGARYYEKQEWKLHSGILGSVCAQGKLRCSRAVLIQLSSSSARGIGSPGLSSPSHAQIPESIDR